jgi:CheY-like chemotaxis protein
MNPVTVLLVEDNPGDVMLVQRSLPQQGQPVQLLTAMDGNEAVTMLSDPEFRPALVILDLYIPKVSSRTVLQRYHERGILVVIFSSSFNEMEKRHAFDHGAVDYFLKPTDLTAFGHTVQKMLEKWVFSPWERGISAPVESAHPC